MDADRIRQAVRVVANILQQCVQGCDEFREGGAVLEAAKAHADWLDGPTDEMVERGRFPILDTTAMFASKMLGITHEEAMEREDIQRMSSIVARAVLEAVFQARKEAE